MSLQRQAANGVTVAAVILLVALAPAALAAPAQVSGPTVFPDPAALHVDAGANDIESPTLGGYITALGTDATSTTLELASARDCGLTQRAVVTLVRRTSATDAVGAYFYSQCVLGTSRYDAGIYDRGEFTPVEFDLAGGDTLVVKTTPTRVSIHSETLGWTMAKNVAPFSGTQYQLLDGRVTFVPGEPAAPMLQFERHSATRTVIGDVKLSPAIATRVVMTGAEGRSVPSVLHKRPSFNWKFRQS